MTLFQEEINNSHSVTGLSVITWSYHLLILIISKDDLLIFLVLNEIQVSL